MRRFVFFFAIACTLALNLSSVFAVSTVRAVLFYSPRCGHCHVVMTEHLPPVQQRFGDQLQIVMINVDQPQGAALYREAIVTYAIPEARRGVPTMIVGDTVLVGSVEIPQRLPDLVETLLERGAATGPACRDSPICCPQNRRRRRRCRLPHLRLLRRLPSCATCPPICSPWLCWWGWRLPSPGLPLPGRVRHRRWHPGETDQFRCWRLPEWEWRHT